MSLRTVNDIFFAVVDRNQKQVLLHRHAIQWVPISSQELYRSVAGVACAVRQWGIGKGDRVAILSENRPEWPITDFACFCLGAIVVPIYSTLTAEQTAHILNDSGARLVVVSSERQLNKLLVRPLKRSLLWMPSRPCTRFTCRDSCTRVRQNGMPNWMRPLAALNRKTLLPSSTPLEPRALQKV